MGRIILINPARLQSSARDSAMRNRYDYPPIGLLTMASHLMMHGERVDVLDFYTEGIYSKADFIEHLRVDSDPPELVGISTYTETFSDALLIARAIKAYLPDTHIVLGGTHATFSFEEALASPDVDFVIQREGEGPLLELVAALRGGAVTKAQIPNLIWRDIDGSLVENRRRDPITHMDVLPLTPYFLLSGQEGNNFERNLIILTSRGCPGTCIFCASGAFAGRDYRMHSAAWVLALVQSNCARLSFASLSVLDDTFLVDTDRLQEFCNGLTATGFTGGWACKSRVDTIDSATVGMIARSNCISVHIGFESANDEVLRRIGKQITVHAGIEAILEIRRHGMRPDVSFICGHPADTRETMEQTLLLTKLISDLHIGTSILAISTPFPGTPLSKLLKTKNWPVLTTDYHMYDLNTPIYETDQFTADDQREILYLYNTCDYEKLRKSGLKCDHTEFLSEMDVFTERAKSLL